MPLKIPSVLLVFSMLVGCASAPGNPESQLDPITAVTISTTAAPLEFTRSSADTATLGALDVCLGPVEINQMGTYRYLLWVALVSHDQPRILYLRILSGGGVLLTRGPDDVSESSAISSSPYELPARYARPIYFSLTSGEMKTLEEASAIDLEVSQDSTHWHRLEVWNDKVRNFAGFSSN